MRIKYNSPVILTYAFVSSLLLLFDTLFKSRLIFNFFTLYPYWEFNSATFYFRLFSHCVGHADWGHLTNNFAFILLIGPILEEKYGSASLLQMMGLTVVITSILHISFFDYGLLGASGIVFMMIILISLTNFRAGELPLTFILVAVFYLGKEFLNSLNNDNISQFGHIIGGICGGILGLMFANKKGSGD